MTLPSPPWATERKPPRRRLSVEAIVSAGLELLAAGGVDAVTMRGVAAKLGTGAASLYAHVRDKGELHLLMLDEVIGEVQVPEAEPEHWQEQLKDVCRSQYAAMTRHPGIALVNIAHIPTGPHALRTSEAMLKILLAGGLSKPVAGLAMDLMTLYPTAVAFEESIWRERSSEGGANEPSVEAAVVAQINQFFRSLPVERFPTVTMMAPFLTAGSGEDRFEFGLSVLVAGLDAMRDWQPRS
jgi:AcrR family transcriptional regulator